MNYANRPFGQLSNKLPEIDYGYAGLGKVQLPMELAPFEPRGQLEAVQGQSLSQDRPLQSIQRALLYKDGPPNYVRPDAFVLDDLAKTLVEDPVINCHNLEIACEEGHVLIQGRVTTQAQLDRLDVLLATVYGIKDADISKVIVSKGVKPPEKAKDVEKRKANKHAEQAGEEA